MVYKIEASCGSFLGAARTENEDNFYFNKKHLPVPNKGLKNPIKFEGTTDEEKILAVFDGMGGESNGEEAACIAAEIFSEEAKLLDELAFSGKEYLYRSCDKANIAVNETRKEKQLKTMGTTVAAVYMCQDEVVACNVGDSKIYRIRDQKMTLISEDHTDEKIMSAIGITKKPVLLQYLGIPDTEIAIEPYISKGDIKSGDCYVICTDGVTDTVDVNSIYEAVCSSNAQDAVRRILATVEENNGADNATAIVIKLI